MEKSLSQLTEVPRRRSRQIKLISILCRFFLFWCCLIAQALNGISLSNATRHNGFSEDSYIAVCWQNFGTVRYSEYRMTVYWYTDTPSGAVSVSNTAVYFHRPLVRMIVDMLHASSCQQPHRFDFLHQFMPDSTPKICSRQHTLIRIDILFSISNSILNDSFHTCFVLIRVGCCLHHESCRSISRDPFRSVFLIQIRADFNQTISSEVVVHNDLSSKNFILNF